MLVKWSKNTLRKFQSKSNDTSANMGFAKMGADVSSVSTFCFLIWLHIQQDVINLASAEQGI